MERIIKTSRKTERSCSCGGDIVEHFQKKYEASNGIIGPGSHRSSFVISTGFSCTLCGLQYAEPVFQKTTPNEQILFELTLSEAVITKKITPHDLPKKTKEIRGKETELQIGSLKIHSRLIKKIFLKTKIPEELKKISPGTKVFVISSQNEKKIYNPENFILIQLDKIKGSRIYKISSDCIK